MKQTKEKQSWKPFLKLLGRNVPWPWYLANFVASLFVSSLTVRLPELTGRIMAGEIFDNSLIVEFMLLSALSYAISVLLNGSTIWAGYRTERNIQRSLWKKMIRMPMEDYDKQPPSTLISRITGDPAQVTTLLTTLFSVLTFIFTLFLIFLNIFGMNAMIALSLALAIPYIIIVSVVPGRFKYRLAAKRQATLAAFTSFVAERLGDITLVKSAAAEAADCQLGYQAAEENYKSDIRFSLVDSAAQPFAYSVEGILGAIVLIMGGRLVTRGELGMDALLTMYLYSRQIYMCMLQMISTFYLLKEAQGATAVAGAILSAESERVERKVPMGQADGDIVFEDVSFGYGGQEVLSHIDLTIPRGKVTAVIGPSGAGKSTLLGLLERLYTPDDGRVLRGGVHAERVHLNEWRASAGYIQQSSPLLSGTIRDNIAYGLNREASEEEIVQAARLARAYDFVTALPEGFDSDVGQLGGKLSGGQRQRIAIARMIVKNPDCLLLDEATSSLDAENEAEVQAALTELMKGRTAVVVAHNLRTVLDADQIVVLDGGRIQAVGSHKKLYAENPLYKRYFDLQFAQ